MSKFTKFLIILSIMAMTVSGCSLFQKDTTDDGGDSASDMQAYKSEDGNFSIMFPGTPEQSFEQVPTEVGDIGMTTLMYEESVTKVYMVAYADYPSELVEASDPDVLIQAAKDGALSSQQMNNLDEETDISINGYTGLYFKANNGQYYISYKIYLVNNRLYQIGILRDGSYATLEDEAAFLDSFTLLKDSKSVDVSVEALPPTSGEVDATIESLGEDEAMEGEAMEDEAMEGDAMEDEAMEGEAMEDEAMEGEAMEGEAMEGEAMEDEAMEDEAMEDEAMEGEAMEEEPVEEGV